MGKFREFLLNEEIGLGELGPKIDDLFNSQLLGGQIGGAMTSMDTDPVGQEGIGGSGGSFGNQSMARSNQLGLPSTDMDLPSVEKTGRLCVVDGGWKNCGLAGEIIASVLERIDLKRMCNKPMRITLPDAPAPTSSKLEEIYYPSVETIVAKLKQNFFV